MRTPTRACVILLIVCLAGPLAACGARLDPKADAAIQAVFDQVRRHDFTAIEARMPPALRTAVADARLQAQAARVPDQPPQAMKLISFKASDGPAGRQTSDMREYFYPDRLLVVSTAIREQPGQSTQILGVNIQPFSRAALAVGRFSLAGKSTTQYFLLALAVLIPLLLVYALAVLAGDQRAKLKWLWTPFILVGFTQLSVNWATGAILFQPLGVLLLGASVVRGPLDVAPWIVSISLPLGALVYLGRVWFAPVVDEPE